MSALAARPTRLYGVLATAEMVTWTVLLLGMLGKYALGWGELCVRVGGGLHGFVFLAYCLVTALIAVDQRWRPGQLAAGLGSAVLPYATLPFERYAARAGLLGDRWRLHSDDPAAAPEHVVAAALRKPLVAAAVAVVALALVFAGLLQAGPPTQWFG